MELEYGFISRMQTRMTIHIMNGNLNINSYPKCKVKYEFIPQMRTQILIHSTNVKLNTDSYHACKLIKIVHSNMDACRKCENGYGFMSQMQT